MQRRSPHKSSPTTTVVVDTNVIVVADGGAPQASEACRDECLKLIREIQGGSLQLVVDDTEFIIREYARNVKQSGVGEKFVIWLRNNQHQHCLLVDAQATDATGENFALFPSDPALAGFDRADRKFVATALSAQSILQGQSIPVVNATDPDWCDYKKSLQNNGVEVRFLCPELMPKPECR